MTWITFDTEEDLQVVGKVFNELSADLWTYMEYIIVTEESKGFLILEKFVHN